MARKGGRAAHQRGTPHRWTPEEAREAGRKGGGVLLRSGDNGRTDRLRGAADALGGIANALEQIAGDPGAATTGGIRALRESIAHVADAVDRIEGRRLHLVGRALDVGAPVQVKHQSTRVQRARLRQEPRR